MELGKVGVWSAGLRDRDGSLMADTAAELEDLGYRTLWFPAGRGRAFEIAANLLSGTRTVAVASGIVSIWQITPEEATSGWQGLEATYPGRFLLGLGVSHAAFVDKDIPKTYSRPLSIMREFLERSPDVPRDRRILGALGPKMLALAASESLGTHPYLVTPSQTARIRQQIGGRAIVAAEQAVVLESDPARAREIGRKHLHMYLQLPNYVNNWRRDGFDASDVEHGGSDRLVDAVVAWGDVDAIARRVRDHHEAGADHVCLQVLDGDRALPMPQLRSVAEAFRGGPS